MLDFSIKQRVGEDRQKASTQENILPAVCDNDFEGNELGDAIESDGRYGRLKLL